MSTVDVAPPLAVAQPSIIAGPTDNAKDIEFNHKSEETVRQPELPHSVEDDDEKDNIQLLASLRAQSKPGSGDGSDSGVDIETTLANAGALQRALSSNSGGYASSCGGLDEPIASCNSSVTSFCSELCDIKSVNTILRHSSQQDCTSEGGSESSSVTGGPICTRKSSMVRKKVALTEPTLVKSPKKDDNSVAKSRSRAASASRAAASKTTGAPVLSTKERARSRDKLSSVTTSPGRPAIPPNRPTPSKRPMKPDSLPSGIKEPVSPAFQRTTHARTPSVPRGRTPGCTPTVEDGRWPSIGARPTPPPPKSNRAGSSTPENLIIKTKVGPISLDAKSPNAVDKFATLPRRRKEKSDEDLRSRSFRSSSVHRDPMTSSMIKRQASKESTPPCKPIVVAKQTMSSRRSKVMPKTKIYHETSVQTALTGQDVTDAFAGIANNVKTIDAVETCDKDCQVDIRDKEIERLQDQLRQMTTDYTALQGTLSERSQMLHVTELQLTREREEKLAMTKELQSNTERIMGMLALVHASPAADEHNCDSLLMLESQIQQSGHALEEKQCEIDKLYTFCKKLQVEMTRSMNVQRNLLEEKEEIEKESTELQDFLQDEKTALVDALREAEVECEHYGSMMKQKEIDIERLQEECRHLVRISEQRRHEYLGMQSKYSALESRSKEMVVQQGSAVSGASVALAGLGARLDQLVDQLISSYSISEQELEDVIFHNEAYTNSASSEDGSPEYEYPVACKPHSDGSLSPQRHQSFIVAVISAIRNAASTAKQTVNKPNSHANGHRASTIPEGEESDSTEMLDSETEPCLMMENVLEDVSMPDSHSHNMVSSTGLIVMATVDTVANSTAASDLAPSEMDREEESIHNLSQAIYNRQQIEQQTSMIMRHNSEHSTSDDISVHESIAEMPSLSEYCCAQPLVDQIISVDNLVTKLLKVLRIIQMDNDHCIQQLICDKNTLQLNKEEMLEKMRDWEQSNLKLKVELEDASHQLTVNCSDLANSKVELQRHRTEIDRLNMDICNLSTLCSQNNTTKAISKEDIWNAMKSWQETKGIPEPELVSHIVAACQEIPVLKEQLLNKERQLNDLTNNQSKPMLLGNLQEAIVETKRQYEAIDRALETLNSIQALVQQCPALASLQRDLEETNFQSASTIPIYTTLLAAAYEHSNGNTADCNANASGSNAPNSNGGVQLGDSNASSNNKTIDSTA